MRATIIAVGCSAGEQSGNDLATRLAQELPGATVRRLPATASGLAALSHVTTPEAINYGSWLEGCDALVVRRLEGEWVHAALAAVAREIPVISADDLPGAPGDPEVTLAGRLYRMLADPCERQRAHRRTRALIRRPRVQQQLPSELRLAASNAPAPWPTRSAPAARAEHHKLSVVIACHGRRRLTENCVASLRADTPDVEIILVDNASPDDTVRWAQSGGLRVLAFPENRGVAPAWNAGLAEATGDLLCVLNNDVIVHPNGMRRLAAAAWRVGISAFQGGMLDAELSCRGLTHDAWRADYPDGCALLFRRDVWERVGAFDEGMELAYCEDSDWGMRARSRGLDWALVPDALTHLGHQTAREMSEMPAFHRRNQDRLRLRWRGKGAGERIKVRRWGMMGDALMVTPALAALRREKPLARLHFQCSPSIAEMLRGIPIVDVVDPGEFLDYTTVHDLDYATWEQEQACYWPHPTFAFAEALGVSVRPESYHVPDTCELDEWARELLPVDGAIACGLRSEKRDKANWGEAAWRGLFSGMPERTFVLLDREARPYLEPRGELYRGRRIYEAANVVDLTGRVPSLRHLLAVLRRCSSAISVDTGIFHLASAAGLPVVAMMGGAPGWARQPLQGRVRILQGEAPCYPCPDPWRCHRSDGGPHCLHWLTPGRVAMTIRSLIG